mgnify:CR=1 FL=1
MFDISILCPTKNRCEGLERMWLSALDTADAPTSIELVLYIEKDDHASLNQVKQFEEKYGNQVLKIVSSKDVIYSDLHNICCQHSTADIFLCAADDLIFRTQSWDSVVKNIFIESNDKIMYVYPNDGHWGEELGTHGFFHKRWYNTLGYISPPFFTVDYADNYIMDVSRSLNRAIYLSHVLLEHMHWTLGKSPFDLTAHEAHQRRLSTNNANIYVSDQVKSAQLHDIQKLTAVIKQYE